VLKATVTAAALAVAAYLLVQFVVFGPLFVLIRVAHRMPRGLEPKLVAYFAQACCLAAVLAILRVPWTAWRRRPAATGGIRAAAWYAAGSVLISLLVSLSLLSGPSPADGDAPFSRMIEQVRSGFPVTGLPGRLLTHGVIGPVFEEILFRVLILGFLLRRTSRWLALLITTALFAALHSNWLHAAFAGLVYGLLYLRYGSVWISTLAHSANNLVAAALVPLLVAYLRETGLLMPLQASLVPLQLACVVVSLACFVMVFHTVFRDAGATPLAWLRRSPAEGPQAPAGCAE
jgi:membrane protease YdiL (CAAX protease family)